MDSDSNFEPNLPPSRSTPSVSRLSSALRQARLSLRNRNARQSFSEELGQRFPYSASTSTSAVSKELIPLHARKKRKMNPWKVVPCSVEGPAVSRVPTRGSLDRLCKVGLGLPTYLIPAKLHYLIITLYPLIRNIPYEFCKAAGPGNTIIVSLPVEDNRRKPVASGPFICSR